MQGIFAFSPPRPAITAEPSSRSSTSHGPCSEARRRGRRPLYRALRGEDEDMDPLRAQRWFRFTPKVRAIRDLFLSGLCLRPPRAWWLQDLGFPSQWGSDGQRMDYGGSCRGCGAGGARNRPEVRCGSAILAGCGGASWLQPWGENTGVGWRKKKGELVGEGERSVRGFW